MADEPKSLNRKKKPAMVATESEEKPLDLSDSGRFQKGLIQIHSRGLLVEAAATSTSDADSSVDGGKSTVRFELGPEDFESLEVVGHGASSYVRKALHKKTQTVMALKVINVFDQDKRKQLMTEVQTLFNCECPQLITFHGAFSHEGSISIALEFATAGSLTDLVRLSGGANEFISGLITEQILMGLRFMHKDRHQIHRDFKPSNLLLDHSGRVMLTDFGVATTLNDSSAMCATFVGTYLYMSPERFHGEKYSYACDIWSLGLVVFEMLTGTYPWKQTKGYWDLMSNIVNEPAPTLPDDPSFGPHVRDFITRCLIKEPEKRAGVLDLLDHPFITRNNHLTAEQKQTEISNWISSQRSVFVSMKEPKIPAEVGHEFVLLYHSIFSGQRHLLSSLYDEDSELSLNGETHRGRGAIMTALLGVEVMLHRDEAVDWKQSASGLDPIGHNSVIRVRDKGAVGFHDHKFYTQEFVLREEKPKSCFYVTRQQLNF